MISCSGASPVFWRMYSTLWRSAGWPAASAGTISRPSALTVSVPPAGVVWDVGAGSGSVAVEAALLSDPGMVYAIEQDAFPATHPLVLLLEENLGKVLGQYVTRWGALPMRLMVIDEVLPRDAQYVQIGVLRHQVVPVSFYGLG